MNSTPTLLVYDDAVETSEVLAAVYQPRGYSVERRSRFKELDESGAANDSVVVMRADGQSASHDVPRRVVIIPANDSPRSPERYQVAACRISSLFDYRELVSAIDQLLCGSD